MIDTNSTKISSESFAAAPAIAQPKTEVGPQAEAAVPLAIDLTAVTVELTDNAKATLLRSEGFNVTEISAKLGLDEETINSYLNLGPKLGF
jgi:hypothetical protein